MLEIRNFSLCSKFWDRKKGQVYSLNFEFPATNGKHVCFQIHIHWNTNFTNMNRKTFNISLMKWYRFQNLHVFLSPSQSEIFVQFRRKVRKNMAAVTPCPDWEWRCKIVNCPYERPHLAPFYRFCTYFSNWQTVYCEKKASKIFGAFDFMLMD